MSQEFTINSQVIEDKINALLPSQGGYGAGIDFSASTMIIPTIDITAAAEGSSIPFELQAASSFSTTLSTATNATTTVTTTTGYFRLVGSYNLDQNGSGATDVSIFLDDGITQKTIFKQNIGAGIAPSTIFGIFDFIVFSSAGKSIKIKGTGGKATINCSSHQVASIDGTLTNPT